MHHHYGDITDKIDEEPTWWDEYAVPRYCDFSPHVTANIYASEAILLQVACQSCGKRFDVAMTFNPEWDNVTATEDTEQLDYGDPPNAVCCPAGPTMNSIPIRIKEFWKREDFEWERVPDLEIEFPN